jgi:large subunit ribosomal protein L31
MKADIHPSYFEKVETHCACGAVFIVGSTQQELQTEICSQCHPFYTGKKKTLDSTGRVDRFKKMTEKAQEKREMDEKTKEAKKKREASRIAKTEEGARKVSKKKQIASQK